MTQLRYEILKKLSRAEMGMTFEELLGKRSDPENLNAALSEMVMLHWVYRANEQDPRFRISGVGEDAFHKETAFRNSYKMTKATLFISIASLILAVVAAMPPVLTLLTLLMQCLG